MIGRWLRKRRRQRILSQPFPAAWKAWLEERVPHFDALCSEEKNRLRSLVQILVAEKEWEGCRGLELTDEIRVTIAGQAGLLLLGLDHDYFVNVRNVLVFPSHYVPHHASVDEAGVVHPSDRPVLGHASREGPVVLSWASAHAGGRNPHDGRNVVLHEFAHKLDFMDGFANGVPVLRHRSRYRRWFEVMQREFEILVEVSGRGRATLIDNYGATHPGEFFAVLVECFFEKPIRLKRRHEALYQVLGDYFGQDPAARLQGSE